MLCVRVTNPYLQWNELLFRESPETDDEKFAENVTFFFLFSSQFSVVFPKNKIRLSDYHYNIVRTLKYNLSLLFSYIIVDTSYVVIIILQMNTY